MQHFSGLTNKGRIPGPTIPKPGRERKIMKRGKLSVVLIVLMLALGLSLGLALTSWAEPWGMMGHPGQPGCPGHPGHWGHQGRFANLTPAQAGQLFDLRQKFLNDTASLRKDMLVKRVELRALWRAENPDEKQILAKFKEINALRDKLMEKVVPLRLQVKKILPPGPGPKDKVSLEEDDMNWDTTTAMEVGGPGEAGL